MNVLSLFDGISCGKLALERANIKYNKYYASEINKYAIAVSKYNHDDIIYVGDIRNLNGKDFKNIDLIIGGSPCQNFSYMGKREGMITEKKIEVTNLDYYLELKEQGYKFKGQSYLFWEYVRLLKEIKPKWFLLENVKMPKKWENIITETLKVKPVEINSSLVSAQNRIRLYWTNIPVIGLPENKNILLKDILENNVNKKYYINKDFIIYEKPKGKLFKIIGKIPYYKYKSFSRIIDINGKSSTILTYGNGNECKIFINNKIRKLTPLEWERLQTLPDNYTKYGKFENNEIRKISDRKRYELIGNGWTVNIIAWIFKFINKPNLTRWFE